MKTGFLKIFAIALFCGLTACSSKAQEVQFQTSTVEEKSGNDELTYNIIYPVSGDETLVSRINAAIAPALVPSPLADEWKEGLSIQETVDWVKKNYFAAAKKERVEAEMDGDMFAYSFSAELKREDSPKNVVTLALQSYDYLGGAHGTPFVGYFSFDTEKGEGILWSDIFSDEAGLLQKVKEQLAAENSDELLEMVEEYTEEFSLPEFPFVGFDKNGVILQYQAYEIGPYAIGSPTVHIPYADALPLMNDYGRRLCSK